MMANKSIFQRQLNTLISLIYNVCLVKVDCCEVSSVYLGRGVAGPGHEGPVVGAEAEGHDVAGVARVHGHLLARLHVPRGARHVAAGGHDPRVVQEPAAREVPAVGAWESSICTVTSLMNRNSFHAYLDHKKQNWTV